MIFIDKKINANGISIAYQIHGDEQNPVLLLVHGLSTPLTGWPVEMVESLVEKGFRVLLIDNRDMGKSEQLNHLAIPNLLWTVIKIKCGFSVNVPYQLEDMMLDTLALLDALGIDKVHVVGASMGGMIAQLIAINHPDRLLSLTSIMSTTGYKQLPAIDVEVKRALAQKPASSDYEDRLNYHVNKWRAIGSPQYPINETDLSLRVGKLLERGISGKGTLRQILAILTAPDRTERLKSVLTPTLVIHGDSDGLVHLDGGLATATAISKAKLQIYQGMGHDFPIELIPSIVNDIVEHAQAVEF
ncbi:alpha/beta fold hydrolase [Colwellia piezophila]|uniref:alpha/beta fold hydrolase n=1 Tax=Colwellia piezophila TaxID=211668 RepID=UPI00037A0DEB|nr:alpha/beta hydrolase [Colwellia piezophila]